MATKKKKKREPGVVPLHELNRQAIDGYNKDMEGKQSYSKRHKHPARGVR